MTGLKASTGWDTTFVEVEEGENAEGLKQLGWEIKEVELRELARGFFQYYAGEGEGAFNMHEQVVSIKNGAPMQRRKKFGGLREEWEQEEAALALKSKIKRLRKGMPDGEISAQEQKRQDNEDDLLAAFAQEPTTDPDLNLDLDLPTEPEEVRDASRSSSPFLYDYDDFEEPGIWSKRPLVVQDPFDLTRNTAGNIEEDVIDALQTVRLPHLSALVSDSLFPTDLRPPSAANGLRASPPLHHPSRIPRPHLLPHLHRTRIFLPPRPSQELAEEQDQEAAIRTVK